jgi:predicted RNA binding protein YcfA (HicA-like mRNA interferase family)
MRLPRDVSGRDLAKALGKLGYKTTRQTGSHMRLTTTQNGEHHITLPTTILSASAPSPTFLETWPNTII